MIFDYLLQIFRKELIVVICLVCVFTAPVWAVTSLPSTITIKMYQLDEDTGSSLGYPCTTQNKSEYGCTALPGNASFYYPYDNSTPTIDLEDYILDVVSKEMNPNIWTEAIALKAQAIASRSYAGWHENNKNDLDTPFNNSNQFQVFTPFAFEWLATVDGSTPTQTQTCTDTNLSVAQQRVCTAETDKFYIAQAANNIDNYPAKAMFLQDMYAETDDGTFDKPYLAGVQDPISIACDAKDIVPEPTPSIGMSQRGANRWARGHECSYTGASVEGNNQPGTDWSVRWDEAAQILTHYYTGVHLRDAANSDQQLTPDYRWNLLDVSWAEAGCPDVIPENGVCTGTFLIQNTGVTAWNTGRIFFDHYTFAEQTNRSTNALINPTGINTTALPGDVVTVTTSISPPPGAIAGSRQTTRFDMAYAENDTVNYFSDREPGHPWYTYNVASCVGYCATYLPLVLKNYFSLTLPFATATDLNYFAPHPDKPAPVSTLGTVNPDTILPASWIANDGHLTPNGAMKLHHSWMSGSGEGYADWTFDIQGRYGAVLAGDTDFAVSVRVGGGWGRDRSSIIVYFTDGTNIRSDYDLGDNWNRRWIKRTGEQGFDVGSNNPSSDGWGPYKNKYLDRIVLRLQFSDQSDDVYIDDFELTVSP